MDGGMEQCLRPGELSESDTVSVCVEQRWEVGGGQSGGISNYLLFDVDIIALTPPFYMLYSNYSLQFGRLSPPRL